MNLPTEHETAQYFTDLLSDYRLQGIVKDYCNKHEVLMGNLTSAKRKQNLVQHRHNVAMIAKEKGFSPKEIGNALNRDRSTIRHYLEEYQPI